MRSWPLLTIALVLGCSTDKSADGGSDLPGPDADADADSDIEAENDEIDDGYGSIIDFYRPADLTPEDEKGGCASATQAPLGGWAWLCGLLLLGRRRSR